MKCVTVRKDNECVFMKASGCSYLGGSCKPVVDNCDGCNRRIEFSSALYCAAAPDPQSKWKLGTCNLATHVVISTVADKVKLNPIKASKRGGK